VANTCGPIFFVNSSLGSSSYEAFVVEVTRRSAHGLSMDPSYTGPTTRGNSETSFVDTYSASHYFQDPYQYRRYASDLVGFDVPHEVKVYVNYELPFGHGERFLSHSRWQNLLAGSSSITSPDASLVAHGTIPSPPISST
jgi:hypothetical protein